MKKSINDQINDFIKAKKINSNCPDKRHEQMIKENLGNGWIWCLHCNRVYKKEEIIYDKKSELFVCPYNDCDGDCFADAWDYESRSKDCGWPDVPEKGVIYDLYNYKEVQLLRCNCGHVYNHFDSEKLKCGVCEISFGLKKAKLINYNMIVLGYTRSRKFKDGKEEITVTQQIRELPE